MDALVKANAMEKANVAIAGSRKALIARIDKTRHSGLLPSRYVLRHDVAMKMPAQAGPSGDAGDHTLFLRLTYSLIPGER